MINSAKSGQAARWSGIAAISSLAGRFSFAVTLDDRRSSALVDQVALLRAAFRKTRGELRKTRGEQRLAIDAIVILPDHLHVIMTLPSGDWGGGGVADHVNFGGRGD
jgi:hypothetical protein